MLTSTTGSEVAVARGHPTLPLWAYVADSVTMPVLSVGPMAVALALPAPVTLDATWTPADPVVNPVTQPNVVTQVTP